MLLLRSMWVVEINTPGYLLATSGRFCLDSEAHLQILFGDEVNEIITYPVLLAEFGGFRTNGTAGMIELQ